MVGSFCLWLKTWLYYLYFIYLALVLYVAEFSSPKSLQVQISNGGNSMEHFGAQERLICGLFFFLLLSIVFHL